ncbi:MAG: HlyD family secretion protein [Chthonomonadales bacterium]
MADTPIAPTTEQTPEQGAVGSGNGAGVAPVQEPPTAARRVTRPLTFAALALVFAAAAILGLRYYRYSATHEATDDAQLASDVIQISPQVSGTVVRVAVTDNQVVRKGDLLVVLDDATYRANVEQARANLDAAIAQAKGAGVTVAVTQQTGGAQVIQAQAGVQQAMSSVASAQADAARAAASITGSLAALGAARANEANSRAGLDTAVAARQRASDALTSAQAAWDTAQAAVKAAQANVQAAQAAATKALRDQQRYTQLAQQGAISAQAADAATAAADTATAQLEAARQQLAQAQAVAAQRQADVNAARQQLRIAEAGISQARAILKAAQEQVAAAQAAVKQARAAKSAADRAVEVARARTSQAQGLLLAARTAPKQVAVSRTAAAQAQARIEQAQAALRAAQIQLGYTRIYAPVGGRVSKKTVEVGNLVQPGTPLMALVPQNDVWVWANFKETQLTHMHAGSPAEVTVDAFPGRVFHGHVDSISAATGATFALIPPDNATGNFTKVVQRIPVKIVLDPNQPGMDRLRAGMSVVATVRTR